MLNYNIRKLYVKLNPLLSTEAHSQRIQWIMRDSPLISCGIPFFLEPWLNGDDWWIAEGRRKWYKLIPIFFVNFSTFIKHKYAK